MLQDELKVESASPEKPKDCLSCRLFNGFSMIALGVYTLNIPCFSPLHKVCMVGLSSGAYFTCNFELNLHILNSVILVSVFTFIGSVQLMKWDVFSALKKQTKEWNTWNSLDLITWSQLHILRKMIPTRWWWKWWAYVKNVDPRRLAASSCRSYTFSWIKNL